VIILHDGKVAELSNDKITIGGESIPVSELSDSQGTTIAGLSIQKKEGEADKPPGENEGEHGGGGGIGGFLGGLVGGAKKAVNGVKDAGESALKIPAVAAEGASAAAFGAIAGKLTMAGTGVDSLVSGLNGIQKAMPVDKLTQAGLGTATDAQNLGRQASNWLSSTGNLVKDFPDLPKKVQDQVVDDIKKFAGDGGQLEKAQGALEAFRDFPWESELPQSQLPSATRAPTASTRSGTSMPTETASRQTSDEQTTTRSSSDLTQSSTSASTTSASNTTSLRSTQSTSITSASNTTSATSSTSSAEPTPETLQYFIITKDGTSLDEFRKFVEEVDGGAGFIMEWEPEYIQCQGYLTMLKPDVGEGLKSKYGFILSANPQFATKEYLEANDEYRAIGGSDRIHHNNAVDLDAVNSSKELELSSKINLSGIIPRTLTEPDPNAPYWKNVISSPYMMIPKPPSLDPPYVADDSAGRGVTIYVIDDGFDLNLEVRPDPHDQHER
jgi:hypothetical protein